jgi:alkylation response protein AidB-like acyl-CoA dehydrogenase
VAFAGPLLARDLARRAAARTTEAGVVAFAPALDRPAIVEVDRTTEPAYVVDGDGGALVLVPAGPGFRLGHVAAGTNVGGDGADLTRRVRTVPSGTTVETVAGEPVDPDDLARWQALGLALTSADLVGVMRGVLAVTVSYAGDRRQFGVPVGSFQAVQHLLADAQCLLEGSHSVSLHASWAVDHLEPDVAVTAGRVAKAYCARAARTVCETAIQVHGGIGNTWDCIAHVYLRRALLSSQWFGDDALHVGAMAGAADGLP